MGLGRYGISREGSMTNQNQQQTGEYMGYAERFAWWY